MRHLRTHLVLGASLVLVAAAWLVAGPAQLGGRTTYVTTHGISMEPRFHTGDLALVRPAADYRVGDVVAYRSSVLHSIILHRIIGRDGDRYVFQGDNNGFVDPVHPPRSALVGRLWHRVPHGGLVLAWLHGPAVAAVLCGVVGLLLLWPARRRRRRGRNRRGRRGAHTPRETPAMTGGGPARLTNPNAQLLVVGCAVVAVLCLMLGVVAWTRPTSHPVAAKVAYTQKVRFAYRADAPAGAVYPDGTVATGDPIFVKLVRRVRVKVSYHLVSGAPAELTGTREVLLRLSSPTGWHRTVTLLPSTPFRGSATSAWVTLDLDQLQATIRRVETSTGAPAGAAFAVDVLPRVRVKGTLAGQPLNARYAPDLSLQLDPLQLRVGSGTAAAAGTAAASALPAVLAQSHPDSVAATAETPNHLTFAGHGLRLATARWIALLGVLLAGAAGLLTLIRERRRPTDLSMQIHARYRHLIVPIAAIAYTPDQPIVDVMTIDALAHVAERCERVILHHHHIGAESYLVDDEGTLYRYQPRGAALHAVPTVPVAHAAGA
ncbi:MAG TPA: signal peptidase I [Baekduia sp.]